MLPCCHELDVGIGWVNMGGRHYDPAVGVFIEPDPIVQAPLFSQSLNRYAYVFNNPLKLIDPTGFETTGGSGGGSDGDQGSQTADVACKADTKGAGAPRRQPGRGKPGQAGSDKSKPPGTNTQ